MKLLFREMKIGVIIIKIKTNPHSNIKILKKKIVRGTYAEIKAAVDDI